MKDGRGKAQRKTPEQMWERVAVGEADSCWPWTGHVNDKGYGYFRGGGRAEGTHRIAYRLSTGEDIPQGMVVMHTCDNRCCCNPAHLRLGTPADNSDDMRRKGRSPRRYSTANSVAKFPDEVIQEVRSRLAAGQSTRAVARATGLSKAWVWQVGARHFRNITSGGGPMEAAS